MENLSGKSVLIIAYVFPPYPGIGGRRWAKFAKYLVREGYNVHVICALNPFDEISLWTKDVKKVSGLFVHSLPPCFPFVFLKKNLSFIEKVSYRFWKIWLTLRYNGTIYDRAIAWRKVLHKSAIPLIRKYGIQNVIVTGAPFHLLHHTVELKKNIPGIRVISDFRDPWTNGKNFGMSNLSDQRMDFEKKLEKEVVEKSDFIISPALELIEYLQEKYDLPKEKTLVIPHGFDPEDFPEDIKYAPEKGKLKITFIGTIYEGLEEMFESMAKSIKKVKDNSPDIFSSIQIEFYVSDNKAHSVFLKYGVESAVTFCQPLSPQQIFQKLSTSHFALVMFTEQYKNYISTKFVEFFHLKLPILFLGPKGKVSEFILENEIGEWISPDEIEEKLPLLLSKKNQKNYPFKVNDDNYTFAHLTEMLITLFQDNESQDE